MLQEAYSVLLEEVVLPPGAVGGKVGFRRSLTLSLLFKFYLEVQQALALMVRPGPGPAGSWTSWTCWVQDQLGPGPAGSWTSWTCWVLDLLGPGPPGPSWSWTSWTCWVMDLLGPRPASSPSSLGVTCVSPEHHP